jgi:hypothetical protein
VLATCCENVLLDIPYTVCTPLVGAEIRRWGYLYDSRKVNDAEAGGIGRKEENGWPLMNADERR